MTPATPYAVVGHAIDAAVLHPESIPSGTPRLKVHSAAAVGGLVNVFPRAGGSSSATILQSFQPSSYVGVLCPHRMIIDTSFAAGDSGSLVKDGSTNDAVGLYTGEITPSGGTPHGVCQIMQQVVTEFAIDLYL
jgi:hypothetical protein